MIQPRTLKGFRDYPPATMIPREAIIETARRVYRSYGFSPIDTPALEHLEILTGKGSDETDKQLYRFEDNGGRAIGMRFDLTIPLARFVAQHIGQLGTPFKRYHIANVWRGETPQRGRFREFMQCDFDTVGTTSPAADIETVLVIHDLLHAIGFERFTIRVNNRKVLTGLLDQLGLRTQTVAVLRALDKLPKIGPTKVAAEMERTANASEAQIKQVLQLASLSGRASFHGRNGQAGNGPGENVELIDQLKPLIAGSEEGEAGLTQLTQLLAGCQAAGVGAQHIQVDVSIARGLDYYTGMVVETFLDDLPEIGSVCSGGRYDNLASLYTKQQLPGVGASLGLDRLLAAMGELNLLAATTTTAEVLLCYFVADHLNDYLKLASQLRAVGQRVEFYPEAKKLGKQLQYANRKGFRVALVIGEDEFTACECQIKDLSQGTSRTVSTQDGVTEIVEEINRILG
jgi:histidyl-tRNA synthetase